MKEALNSARVWAIDNLKGDPVIWFIVILLSMFSILVVYSATGSLAYARMGGNTEYYLIKHTILVGISLFVMWLAHRLDYRYYSRISRLALLVSVPLIIYAWLFGPELNDTSRWINVPIINQSFQPSDLASLALIVSLASMLAKRQNSIDDFLKALVPMLIWIGVICGLIAMTNFSSAILLFGTCFLILFIGRIPVKYLGLLVLIGIIAGSVALSTGDRYQTVVNRWEAFVTGELPYQAQQSRIAIASGGLIGKGPGQSEQRNFLPHPYSDFVYAIIIEEYGLLGGMTVLMFYLALLYRGMRAVANSERTYGGLLSAGLSFALVMQALVNMGVAVGLGPVTGLTLPLVSMGGTSQLFTGLALGIILSVSRGETDSSIDQGIGNQYREAA